MLYDESMITQQRIKELNGLYDANNNYKQCSIGECNRSPRDRKTGWCDLHLSRFRIHGDPLMGKPVANVPKCLVASCTRGGERNKYCLGHYQRVKKHGNPLESRPIEERNGWYLHSTGYIVIPKPGHPNAQKSGSIMEHIYVMSEFLGRPLVPRETVHHKNGQRWDNRIENLELWSGNHPKGARVADQIRWANEIIKMYGSDEGVWENV